MAAAAPTGCFKCGRPGHWSRDCPSTPSSAPANPNPRSTFPSSSPTTPKLPNASQSELLPGSSSSKKLTPKTRPKLTPDLLLSDDGLGYVLRHFPKAFKYHGRSHEASDLSNLIGLYSQWHSRLLPYYSFDQFIQKVEQVGGTRRVRQCIAGLRERVSRGGDPTWLNEPSVEVVQDCAPEDGTRMEDPNVNIEEPPLENQVDDEMQEEILNEVFHKATQEENAHNQTVASTVPTVTVAKKVELTDEQKERIEANRKKALERAAARALASSQAN